jgi:hypothetical protein
MRRWNGWQADENGSEVLGRGEGSKSGRPDAHTYAGQRGYVYKASGGATGRQIAIGRPWTKCIMANLKSHLPARSALLRAIGHCGRCAAQAG